MYMYIVHGKHQLFIVSKGNCESSIILLLRWLGRLNYFQLFINPGITVLKRTK